MSGFDATLLELIGALRRAGLRVSPAESMDALTAASAIGLEDREDLRAGLGATLVKREAERPAFDRTFDAFFARDAEASLGVLDVLRAEGADARSMEALARRIEAAQQGGGAGGGLAALLQGGAELERSIEAALAAAGVSEMQSSMQVGLVALRALEALGVDAMQRDLAPLRAALARELGEEGERIADLVAVQIEALRRRVRGLVRRRFEAQNPERLARSRAERLERAALAALTKDEVQQVTREVRHLGRVLRDRMERQRRRARRGRLDVRRTVRASLRTGGIPFRTVMRKRRRDRPSLVVLCDVSDSVRAAARFSLVLVYTMQEAFSRTRSFVFVSELGESTALFARHPADEAVTRAFRGEVVSTAANSDYGRALGTFTDRFLDAIDHKTTVVVLGDARSNRLDPNLGALAEVRRRAARVIWLNPEPRASWGFGDSEMLRYLPFCTFAAPVRSLSELRDAVDRLATVVSR
jgi:uncharacterized protein with von Willebrand factor type A (vWA) domain